MTTSLQKSLLSSCETCLAGFSSFPLLRTCASSTPELQSWKKLFDVKLGMSAVAKYVVNVAITTFTNFRMSTMLLQKKTQRRLNSLCQTHVESRVFELCHCYAKLNCGPARSDSSAFSGRASAGPDLLNSKLSVLNNKAACLEGSRGCTCGMVISLCVPQEILTTRTSAV